MNETKIEFLRNGFKAEIAMFLICKDLETTESLQALVMSMPLGAAMAMKSVRLDQGKLVIELTPQLFDKDNAAAEMMRGQVIEALRLGASEVLGIMEEDLTFEVFGPGSTGTVDEVAMGKALDGMSLPPEVAKILSADARRNT